MEETRRKVVVLVVVKMLEWVVSGVYGGGFPLSFNLNLNLNLSESTICFALAVFFFLAIPTIPLVFFFVVCVLRFLFYSFGSLCFTNVTSFHSL